MEGLPNSSSECLKTPSGKAYSVSRIIGEDNNEYVVLEVSDWVALAIDVLKKPGKVSQALSRLDDDEKGTIILNDSVGRNQDMAVISKSGMYGLVLSSRKPKAQRFKRWVRSELLTQIQKICP